MIILEFFIGGLFDAVNAAVSAFPFILPVALGLVFWIFWVRYVQQLFISNTPMILLEVRLPKELFKSPKAMEVVLGTFYQTGPSNWYDAYWGGKVRAHASLEIVSDGGTIHFYIYARKGFKNLIESQVYAQYPEVEIYEVPDYTLTIPYGTPGSDWQIWGTEYKLTKDDAYPIKTYIDFELHKDPKEEFKVDPLTSVLEYLGSIEPGQQVWFQIMFMATGPFPPRQGAKELPSWQDQGKVLVEKLTKRDLAAKAAAGQLPDFAKTSLSPGERFVLESAERNLGKLGFDVGMRTLYLAPKDKFSGAVIPGLAGLLRAFTSNDLNGFRPARATSVDFPWQDPFGVKVAKKKQKIFEAYCKRGYFFYPYTRKPFVLSAEELATVFHFPGTTASTPTLSRIESKRGEAPVDLPI